MTKRRDFFSNETVQALRILSLNHMTREQMRGSWAGAMGNMQFMPSTFMKWGVDRTGDGRIDCGPACPTPSPRPRISCAASVETAAAGRRRSVPAPGLPARPGRHDGREAGARLGADGREEGRQRGAAQLRRALVDHPAGGPPWPAFILYPNFKAVMNWNRSTLYALSVAILAQQIVGGPPVMQGLAGRRRAAVARHRHRHAEPPRPPHPLHRRGRRPFGPQDALGGAALPEADRHAGRRPSDARFVRRLQQARWLRERVRLPRCLPDRSEGPLLRLKGPSLRSGSGWPALAFKPIAAAVPRRR